VPNAVGVSLARNRRSPKRPSEPRPSGVHPEEGEVKKRWRSLPFGIGKGFTGDGLAGKDQCCAALNCKALVRTRFPKNYLFIEWV
jgi:hypothetical protein